MAPESVASPGTTKLDQHSYGPHRHRFRDPYDRASVHVLSASDVAAVRDGRRLLADVSLGVSTDDRIGVIGRNGAGKSTLLRILAGVVEPDGGRVVHNTEARVATLGQQPDHDERATALETALATWRTTARAHEARATLDRLGIDPQRRLGELSGGQRRRVALAATLLRPADLLVLDEPTNHLDVGTIDWLEGRLRHHGGALLMVTHDRYLLERVTTHMLELERRPGRDPEGRIFRHEGSYSDVLEARRQRRERREREARRRRNRLRKEIAWLRRDPKARTSKPQFRVEQAERLMAETDSRERIQLNLGTGRRRLGSHVLDVEGVTKHFGDDTVLDGVEWHVGPGDRVGLVGPNGSGKTTLLQIVAGRMAPDQGSVTLGQTVLVGLYEQEARSAPSGTSVLDTVRDIAPHIPLASGETLSAARLCERFGFEGGLQQRPVDRLSGGERRRLALLHTLVRAPNLLILDEPTNDLDLDTLSVLEDHLDGFAGTLIVASHDRYLLDRLTDEVYGLVDGTLSQHLDWADYRAARAAGGLRRSAAPAEDRREDGPSPSAAANRRRQAARRELASLERRIEELEEAAGALRTELAGVGTDFERAARLEDKRAAVEAERERLEDRWLELSVRLEG